MQIQPSRLLGMSFIYILYRLFGMVSLYFIYALYNAIIKQIPVKGAGMERMCMVHVSFVGVHLQLNQ